MQSLLLLINPRFIHSPMGSRKAKQEKNAKAAKHSRPSFVFAGLCVKYNIVFYPLYFT